MKSFLCWVKGNCGCCRQSNFENDVSEKKSYSNERRELHEQKNIQSQEQKYFKIQQKNESMNEREQKFQAFTYTEKKNTKT